MFCLFYIHKWIHHVVLLSTVQYKSQGPMEEITVNQNFSSDFLVIESQALPELLHVTATGFIKISHLKLFCNEFCIRSLWKLPRKALAMNNRTKTSNLLLSQVARLADLDTSGRSETSTRIGWASPLLKKKLCNVQRGEMQDSHSKVLLSTWVRQIFFFINMATTCQFALSLCMLLLVSTSLSLASDDTGHRSTISSDNGNTSSSGSDTETGHDTSGDTEHGGGGHENEPITTVPIVSWKWHHVETPYLVALWILVSWLCKLGESLQTQSVFHR